jgi:hypothetical protein
MRLMYDSITASDIPGTSTMVAGYVDGGFKWSDADWARFPDKVKVRIAALATTDDGDVLDVENGDATPAQAPGWVARRRAATGTEKTVYCNLSNVQAIRDAFAADGVPMPLLWLAHYGAPPALVPGFIALQYANPDLTGGHYDASVVADLWPGVDPAAPVPTPDAHITRAEFLAYQQDVTSTILAMKKAYDPLVTAPPPHEHSGTVTVK